MFVYRRFRLYPSRAQERRLTRALAVCRRFYNDCLERRIVAHRAGGRVGLAGQLRSVAPFRAADAEAAAVHSHTLQLVASELDQAWRAWLRAGGKGQGPRPRGEWDTRSVGFKQMNNGVKLDGRRLRLFKVGRVAVRWHRPLEGTPKTVRVSRAVGRWFVNICCEVDAPAPLPPTGRDVGIDLGVENLVALSDGRKVKGPQFGLAAREEIDALRRRRDMAVPGTPAHSRAAVKLGRAMVRVAARRYHFAARLAGELVAAYDRIAVEALPVGKLAAGRASVADAAWGLLIRLLRNKAREAGRTVTFVRAAWTTQTCGECMKRSRRFITAEVREFRCQSCGNIDCRDVNAAKVILRRAGEAEGWPRSP